MRCLGATRLLLISLALHGCGPTESSALVVSVKPADRPVSQLRFIVRLPDGQSFGPVVKPDSPGELLTDAQALRLLLPDPAQETTASVFVEGLHEGAVTSSGSGEAVLAPGIESQAEIVLVASGCTCEEGQRCVAGACVCDATSCPTGCCAEASCRQGDSREACGQSGEACQVCSGKRPCQAKKCAKN